MSNDRELWAPPETCELCHAPIEGDAYHTMTDGSWLDVCPSCYADEWHRHPANYARSRDADLMASLAF